MPHHGVCRPPKKSASRQCGPGFQRSGMVSTTGAGRVALGRLERGLGEDALPQGERVAGGGGGGTAGDRASSLSTSS